MTKSSPFSAANFFVILAMLFIVTPVSADPTGGFLWQGHQDIFFQNTSSSTVPGYYVMDHIPKVASESTIKTVIPKAAEATIGTWIIPVGSPLNNSAYTIAPGIWAFHMYGFSSNPSGLDTYKMYLINRSASGVETNLFYGNAISADIPATTDDVLFEYVRRNFTYCNPGDRLVIRINGSTTSNSGTTITTYLDGNTRVSRVSSSYWVSSGNQFPTSNTAAGEAGNDLAYAVVAGFIGGFFAILYWKRRRR